MRIAFLGKGGSGKTTTAAGFVRSLSARYPFVLAVDADVNAHFKTALGLTGDSVHLESRFDEVIDHLRGARTDLGERPMLATTPPSSKSNFIRVKPDDELLKRYALIDGNIALLTVGHYKAADVGGSCYHTKLFGLAAILHHMLDGADDFVVADTTAGTDNLATSLWFAYDMNVFVVEPTAKSVGVYRDFISVSAEIAEKTYVVGNKVEGEEDEQFIRESVEAGRYLGGIPLSRHLKRFEQGRDGALDAFRKEQEAPLEAVLEKLLSRKRDWTGYLQRLRETHTRVCGDWFNTFYGTRLDDGLDAEFSYELSEQPGSDYVDVPSASHTAGSSCVPSTQSSATTELGGGETLVAAGSTGSVNVCTGPCAGTCAGTCVGTAKCATTSGSDGDAKPGAMALVVIQSPVVVPAVDKQEESQAPLMASPDGVIAANDASKVVPQGDAVGDTP
ncbi:MAG: hypothetical protein K2X93_14055 [Candidatus Obscuribacterales bacterium]|nr:hypothetical protein [Candidatus Obscuribacterales bacterium]